MSSPPPAEAILFRPSKKRKIYRQRQDDTSDEPNAPASAPSPQIPGQQSIDELIASSSTTAPLNPMIEGDEVEGAPVSMAEILRLRKKNKRVGGVEFRAEAHAVRDEEGQLVVRSEDEIEEGSEKKERGVPRRFAPQTGTVGDVNKHMMAYIDSELAKRRSESAKAKTEAHTQSQPPLDSSTTLYDPPSDIGNLRIGDSKVSNKKEVDVQRQPAALGKLLEIDLGDEARNKNVQRTEQARRRLEGEEVEDEGQNNKPAKVRLGRDGKPWRGRKRRASEDIKRDRLVEDVLRENRLDIYEEPAVEPAVINDDQAADDRIAEAFKREFMDAVSARQRKKAAPGQPPARTAAGKKEEELLKGPKLGGSRNARAAMRETMLKSAKK